ncbi:hypothetical protein HBH56_039490 [Parastagonospora nodorum]|nr:hypothetical protein HBH56_039490 [Parastagonospora nodorum]KAH3934067.1 hypothetical protein HBH54_059980 [Parastagonospora nodorum]KAH3941039.1 hypothetical protein HBH53_208310 [Parastagonospora nodorum]KAH3957958.1 hypothetical protein HBH51_215990 [Parastagonospora nodorum]KAH4049865.1 hypothetical protein HBH49_138510 [Parastagonospora nodorum]
MGSLQNISLNPVLQKYVKAIIFDGSIYNAAISSGKELWKRYQELYKEQVDLSASGVLLHTIARALEWTTDVSSVVYSPHPRLICSEKKLMKDLLPRDSTSSEGQFDGHPAGLSRSSTHPFRQLIGAIHLAEFTGIRELRILPFDDRKPGTPFTFDFFSFPDASDIQAGRFLFQNLTSLELHIRILLIRDNMRAGSFGTSTNKERQALAHLSHLLAATNELRHLILHVGGWDPVEGSARQLELGPRAPVFNCLGLRKTWLKLRSLSLGGLHSSSDEFLDFARRHRDTLQSLPFQECSLPSGTWAEIVDEVVHNSHTISSFFLRSVNETYIPIDNGTILSPAELDEWKYEGHIEVSTDGERKFVEIEPTKKSVYLRTT